MSIPRTLIKISCRSNPWLRDSNVASSKHRNHPNFLFRLNPTAWLTRIRLKFKFDLKKIITTIPQRKHQFFGISFNCQWCQIQWKAENIFIIEEWKTLHYFAWKFGHRGVGLKMYNVFSDIRAKSPCHRPMVLKINSCYIKQFWFHSDSIRDSNF